MRRFTVPCDFGSHKAPFDVYIGNPLPRYHPLKFQAAWIREQRGGTIPAEVMESFEKLFKLAQKNDVSFEDLCVYAMNEANKVKEEDRGDSGQEG